jgi:hypothetical protein
LSLLGRLGIDARQWKALVAASLLMDLRGHPLARRGGRGSPVRGLVVASLVQAACSLLLALGTLRSRLVLESLCLGYSMTLAATAMLADYSAQVLLPDDADILGHRPIAPQTLLAARVTNVFFYLTLIGISLNLPPALIGITSEGLRFPLAYLPVAFLADFVAAGAVLAAQALLLARLERERFKDLLAYVQGSLAFLIFLTYQMVPRLIGMTGKAPVERPVRAMLAIPPCWFAALVELVIAGKKSGLMWALGGLAVAASTIALPLAMRRLARLYDGERLSPSAPAPIRMGRSLLFRAGVSGLQGPARAAYELAWGQLARDRALKIALVPVLVLPFATLTGAVWRGGAELRDPGSPGSSPLYFATYAGVTMLALMPAFLRYSSTAGAAWILRVAPVERPTDLWRGARRALLVRLVLPTVLAITVVLAALVSPVRALAHVGPAAAAGLVMAALGSLSVRDLPLSLPRQGGMTTNRILGSMIVTYAVAGALGVAHAQLAWGGRPGTLAAYAVGLAALGMALLRLGDRRFAARFDAAD